MKAQGWAFNPALADEREARIVGKASSHYDDGRAAMVTFTLERDDRGRPSRLRLTLTAEEATDLAEFLAGATKEKG